MTVSKILFASYETGYNFEEVLSVLKFAALTMGTISDVYQRLDIVKKYNLVVCEYGVFDIVYYPYN